jgi:two-component system, response regulator PdtaR
MTLVLIVEDEPLIQAFDESVLQEAGCETLTAASYEEVAGLLAGGHKPDLALIDGNLSDGATGSKVARIIREHAPAVRVVYTSANLGNDANSQFVTAAEMLPKPYTPDELKEVVLDGRRRRAAPQAASVTSIRRRT